MVAECIDGRAVAGPEHDVPEGVRPVKLSHVQFKAEPKEGRLVVTGHVRLQVGEQTIGTPGKDLAVMAEFASREGTVVLTRLSRAQEN